MPNIKSTFYEVIPMEYLPCAAGVFTIKGRKTYLEDFGDYYIDSIEEEEGNQDEDIRRWGCAGKYFKVKPYNENIKTAAEYNLDTEEYNILAQVLEDAFAIGVCGWCV